MKRRCYDKNHESYHNYGGRGIEICDSWLNSFENFLEDMGQRPEGFSLDRVDNDKSYSKDNCRWATRKEQASNTRRNIRITFQGKTQILSEWCVELNLDYNLVKERLSRGWLPKDAFKVPLLRIGKSKYFPEERSVYGRRKREVVKMISTYGGISSYDYERSALFNTQTVLTRILSKMEKEGVLYKITCGNPKSHGGSGLRKWIYYYYLK